AVVTRRRNNGNRHPRYFGASLKNRQIPTLGDANNYRLIFPLVGKVVLQLHPENAGLRANYVVFVWIVAGQATVDVNADLLFGSLLGLIVQGATADMQKKSAESR